jgi:hypothetical protein
VSKPSKIDLLLAELRAIRRELELLRRETQAAGRARPSLAAPKAKPRVTEADIEEAKRIAERLGLVRTDGRSTANGKPRGR